MIPQRNISPPDWQTQLRDVVRSGDELLRMLRLKPEATGYSAQAGEQFELKVPRAFVARMQPGNADDPLLRQVLTHADELSTHSGFTTDPVGETGAAIRHPGIIQKYKHRVLLLLSGGCAINCRYCFRRHFPYSDNRQSRREWLAALDHISDDTSITEVILSGGDPLLVADDALQELIEGIASIAHVQRIRVHTRLPVVIPDRVTTGLLDALCNTRLQPVLVIHSNHANELDNSVADAMTALRLRGVTLLNQAVLLARVNDSTEALIALSERLFTCGVLPYYLHLLDPVKGAAHFDVTAERGVALIDNIAAALPGYLVPKLVREEAGYPAKVPISR